MCVCIWVFMCIKERERKEERNIWHVASVYFSLESSLTFLSVSFNCSTYWIGNFFFNTGNVFKDKHKIAEKCERTEFNQGVASFRNTVSLFFTSGLLGGKNQTNKIKVNKDLQ